MAAICERSSGTRARSTVGKFASGKLKGPDYVGDYLEHLASVRDYGDKGDFQEETYSDTKVAAYEGVNTRQNVREGTANTYTPLAQGTRFTDVEITYRIHVEMRADTSLSQNAENVEVGTLDGRVTLRGHVNTDEGKRVIGEIAAKIAKPENVSNLLEVRPVPVTGKQAN